MTKVRRALSCGICSKFRTLSSSTKILKISLGLTKLQSLQVGTFLRHSVYTKLFSILSGVRLIWRLTYFAYSSNCVLYPWQSERWN